jgi:ABC-type uncharacterized transport system fused permease/ATPase subunit
LTFDVICSTCFGMQIDSIKNPDDPFAKAVKEVVSNEVSIAFVFMSKLIYFLSLGILLWLLNI